MCDQQRLRPACAYTQTDQSLCKSLEYSMTVKLLIKQHLEFLSLKGGCTGSYESTLVKMPHCWKSHGTAHLFVSAPPPSVANLAEDYRKMVNNETFSDVEFLVDGKTIYAHKVILSARCDYFRAMFQHSMKESKKV